MNLYDHNFTDLDGNPALGKSQASIIIPKGTKLSKAQYNEIKARFATFCNQQKLSVIGHALDEGVLSDGTPYRFEHNQTLFRAWAWPDDAAPTTPTPRMYFASDDQPWGVSNLGVAPVKPEVASSGVKVGSIFIHASPQTGDVSIQHGVGDLYGNGNTIHPGNMDWFCSTAVVGDPLYGKVLTWWAPFAGRYSRGNWQVEFSKSGMKRWQTLGAAIPGSFGGQTEASTADAQYSWLMHQYVWLNGAPLVMVSDPVILGACLTGYNASTKRASLLVLTADTLTDSYLVHERAPAGNVRCWQCFVSLSVTTKQKAITTPTLLWATAFPSSGELVQPVHCNAEGSKAVFVSDNIWEINLASGGMSTPTLPWSTASNVTEITIGTRTYTTSGVGLIPVLPTGSLGTSGLTSDSMSQSYSSEKNYVICADYVYNTLSICSAKKTFAGTYSYTASFTGITSFSGSQSLTATGSLSMSGDFSYGIQISVNGVSVYSDTATGTNTASQSTTTTYNSTITGTTDSAHVVESRTETATKPETKGAIQQISVTGDLRTGKLVAIYSRYRDTGHTTSKTLTIDTTFSWASGTGSLTVSNSGTQTVGGYTSYFEDIAQGVNTPVAVTSAGETTVNADQTLPISTSSTSSWPSRLGSGVMYSQLSFPSNAPTGFSTTRTSTTSSGGVLTTTYYRTENRGVHGGVWNELSLHRPFSSTSSYDGAYTYIGLLGWKNGEDYTGAAVATGDPIHFLLDSQGAQIDLTNVASSIGLTGTPACTSVLFLGSVSR